MTSDPFWVLEFSVPLSLSPASHVLGLTVPLVAMSLERGHLCLLVCCSVTEMFMALSLAICTITITARRSFSRLGIKHLP